MTDSRTAKIGILLAALGVAVGLAAWLWPRSHGYPKFEGVVSSMEEAAEFDKFITEHTGERVRVKVTFSNPSTIVTKNADKEPERDFLLGDVRCNPLGRDFCENRFSYRVLGMREDDLETQFGWIGQTNYLLRGTYSVVGTGIQMGIQWRTIQAVRGASAQSPA